MKVAIDAESFDLDQYDLDAGTSTRGTARFVIDTDNAVASPNLASIRSLI